MGGLRWTRLEQSQLDGLLDRGLSDAAIARRLGRTENAVRLHRKRLRLAPVRRRWLSARATGGRLGRNAGTVARWCEERLLRAKRGGACGAGGRQWLIAEAAVYDFLADPRTWPRWDPAQIRDPDWRSWALEHRRERYLRLSEVAARYHVVRDTVSAWIERGHLAAVRQGRGNRLVPESALTGWTPPYARSQRGHPLRRFSAEEDALILDQRAAGRSWRVIAEALTRNTGSVTGRWHRLQWEL